MYIALVLLQTLILPLVCGSIHLAVAGGNPLIVFGLWWAFWGVGTRLSVAGISQITNPARTTRDILEIEDAGGEQVVHELGFANLSMGLVGLVCPFIGGWAVLGAASGAVYLALAGLRHVAKRGKSANELVATWTDVLVFVMVAVGTVAIANSR
jgi:hypothetical protein